MRTPASIAATRRQRLSLLICACAVASLLWQAAPGRADELADRFRAPPPSAWPWVYWFPLDGNITREGITADLEAMQRVGIGGVLYMETAQGTPKGPAAFGGPAWRELIQHACAEASRLGLEINMNNDAGWCGSGGPWITPELSMQKLSIGETFVTGPRHYEAVLPRPPAVKDYYRDIAVLAMPSLPDDGVALSSFSPKATASGGDAKVDWPKLVDGNAATAVVLPLPAPKAPQWVQIEFPQPFAARTLRLALGGPAQPVRCVLQYSDDGQKFKTIREFDARPPLTAVSCEAPAARWYRITFPRADRRFTKLSVNEVDLRSGYRLESILGEAAFTMEHLAPLRATFPTVPAEQTIGRDRIVELTAKMDAAGKLTWDVPEGRWTILRIGHTTTGKDNHPAPEAGRGLECDKLSKAGIEAHFAGLMAKLVADSKPLVGKSLVTTHIDSWEVGSQNWTPQMREEFRRLRGYDPLMLLPVVTGRVVDNVEVSKRFLADLRQTISDLLVENYAGHMHTLAAKHGLRLSIEAYGEPADDMAYAGRADEPMGEFWSWGKFGAANSCTEMASAAHVYGKPICGAEAFTATNAEKWLGHPANIKDLGDWAFCEGINRFVFHRYALQPWIDVKPGVSMGPWGLHYERTQTWWEQSKAWHEYLARCQYLLQQGLFVADICYLQPEGAPRAFSAPAGRHDEPYTRPGYNFDGCTSEVVLTRMRVKDGRIVLPDGMSYRVLVLPDVETMTPQLLAKLQELVEAGATVIGAKPPRKSPSLTDYPRCDEEVVRRADALWADRRFVAGKTAEQLLGERGTAPDFAANVWLRYIHRAIGATDVYFVANPEPYEVEAAATFRVDGKRPEFWWPDSGRIEPAAAFESKAGCTSVPLRLEPNGSVFVVFRASAEKFEPAVSLTRDGQSLLVPEPHKAKIVIQKALYGLLDDPQCTRDVRAKLQAVVDGGELRVRVARMAEGDDPAYGIVKTLQVDYTADGQPLHVSGEDPQVIRLVTGQPAQPASAQVRLGDQDRLLLETSQPGRYEVKTAGGKTLHAELREPPPVVHLDGPWQIAFPPNSGAPENVKLDKLISWSEHAEPGVKYFSGTATYRKTFDVPPTLVAKHRRLELDLGKVAVMAEVQLNGRGLGILWKPSYRVEVSDAIKPGQNALEVRVVNLWVNRQIGDEQLPDDSPRADGITLKAWPQWLLEGKPSPTGRHTFTSHRLWKKDDPLQESGLLGPVVLRAVELLDLHE